jgi:hypothetical protein
MINKDPGLFEALSSRGETGGVGSEVEFDLSTNSGHLLTASPFEYFLRPGEFFNRRLLYLNNKFDHILTVIKFK